MGTSTDAILAYGYELGSPDDGLEVAEAQETEANPYGFLKLSWYDAEHEDLGDDEDEDEMDMAEMFCRRLYEQIPDAPPVEYAFQCREPVKEHYGVWFESHCSDDYPMLMLVTASTTASRGNPKTVDPLVLQREPVDAGWDDKLETACRALGITPLQGKPCWLLASDWG